MVNVGGFNYTLKDFFEEAPEKIGTLADVTGLQVIETGTPFDHVTKFLFDDVDVTINHSGGNDGVGTLKIYDFPQPIGLIRRGSFFHGEIAEADANITDTTAFEFGMGTSTQTNNATALDTGRDNIFSSNVDLSSTGEIQAFTAGTTTIIDAAAVQRSIYMNFAGVDTTGNGTITVNGELIVHWSALFV